MFYYKHILCTVTKLNGELNKNIQVIINNDVTGWSFVRCGNVVTFTFNRVLSQVQKNFLYNNQGHPPTGYVPTHNLYFTGKQIVGTNQVGDFYLNLRSDGVAVVVSNSSHDDGRSYCVSGTYITNNPLPTL